ncbi:MAG: hypothetical protein EWV50_00630 [Microcystis aeruginosa Ma_MB_F_20061100_S20]|uniref:Uncharacterized protein n=1 Tax=Microcystis aeruginosa Ma_MB_F_20061100_S20D TaxID=2486253 RepID=A0A552EL05_MICAE|nr:MAG: hypothetical protein EWV78_11495 [Microcystis aeruginosa Ma_MB_F_20061100_S20D]TRU43251.1 MAG: hypothetical protein EWV50_00630 [Microcystis aeruginosa Ma_MB_F_20061100_S20]
MLFTIQTSDSVIPLSTIKNEVNKMKTLSRLNSKESALTVLVIVSQIVVVNDRVIAQSIPQISIPGLAAPVIPVTTPNVAIPTVNVTTTNNIPATSLISQPVIPTVNVTTTNNIPATSLRSQPIIPTVNVTTTNNIPSTSLINSPTPVIPTVNVTFNNKGVPTAVPELNPLTFSVTGSEDNPSSFLSVINNNNNGVTPDPTNDILTGVVKTSTGTSIPIPQPTAVNGQLVTVSTVNVVFPSSQTATGITSSFNNSFGDTSNPFTIQSSTLTVNFTPPVLD